MANNGESTGIGMKVVVFHNMRFRTPRNMNKMLNYIFLGMRNAMNMVSKAFDLQVYLVLLFKFMTRIF
jgi:hypothetical protein